MTDGQNEGEEDTQQHELVIIRRRGDGEEAPHKGGVWKIAHADFMTALMAFFLVMWLINATDEKTASGIANYFNPMRLSDSNTRPKGVFSMEAGEENEETEEGKESSDKPPKGDAKKATESKSYTEATLFSDPYKALDQIAAQAGKAAPEQAVAEKGTAPARRAGDAFRDPFDPDLRYGPLQHGQGADAAGDADKNGGASSAAGDADKQGGASATAGDADKQGAAGTATDKSKEGKSEFSTPDAADGGDYQGKSAREELKERIEEAIRQSPILASPSVDVETTGQGLLISITDQDDFEMFGIASAQPKAELVVLMDKIGSVLAERPEQLVIRGHTDGRKFRSKDYDNWRLSTARAHMANYMLVRSGIDEKRVARVEGHADHDLKVGDDPLAAENRRIEILLVKAEP